jgi:metal-responsive CopG/Arc/MetJ family transcriptional regulator
MEEERINVKIELPLSLLAKIDDLRIEWGIKSRGDIIERLLQELFKDEAIQGTDEAESH